MIELPQFLGASISTPIPLYSATGESMLAGATLTSSLCFVTSGDEAIAIVEVANGVVTHINEGPFVKGLRAAIAAAEKIDGDRELRVLRIPALYSVSVWLAGPYDNILIPAAPSPLRANEPYDEAQFVEALAPVAETRADARDSS